MTDHRKLATEALERAEKATAGPWISDGNGRVYNRDAESIAGPGENFFRTDAAFIAAARSDVPALAKAVLELLTDLEEAEARWRHITTRGDFRKLEAKLSKAMEALQFYGNMDNWDIHSSGNFNTMDYGQEARQALAAIDAEGGG